MLRCAVECCLPDQCVMTTMRCHFTCRACLGRHSTSMPDPAPLALSQEAAAPAGDESDEEDEFVYNPLKLPLGWDGKPIPYWLYKLHGLNLEFKCEICGECAPWARAGRLGFCSVMQLPGRGRGLGWTARRVQCCDWAHTT